MERLERVGVVMEAEPCTAGGEAGKGGRQCLGQALLLPDGAIGSPGEVGQKEVSQRYDTSHDFSWVDATHAWTWR